MVDERDDATEHEPIKKVDNVQIIVTQQLVCHLANEYLIILKK